MQTPRPILLPVLAAILAAALTFAAAERLGYQAAAGRLDQSLLLTARAVEAEIGRFRALPDVAGEDARIRAALADPAGIGDANLYLERIAAHTGADIYLIAANGRTIAASNWNRPESFVGQDYNFRPYFRDAMAGGQGQFYAIGVTTGIPGYFLSRRIDSPRRGVLVVKIDLRPLQATWQAAGLETALADADGMVFLSGRADWLYRPLSPLPQPVLDRVARERTWVGTDPAGTTPLLRADAPDGFLGGAGWIGRDAPLPAEGWRLIAATPSATITAMAAVWAAVAALATLALAGAAMVWQQRRQILALRLSQSERLEAMVTERTADLAREVEARRQAENDLRAAQEGLIHAEKMAALGRMSTAIVHEISQPLAAMEATLTAAEITLPAGESRTAPRLATAKGLIRRMQRTIKHLKSFGRKEPGERRLTDLGPVIASAIELVTPRARAVGVNPVFVAPDVPQLVMAGVVRMEQVVVNLLLNALDAVEGCTAAAIIVTLDSTGETVRIRVTDTGPGIAPEDLPRVAEPFFSTKPGGAGLGLGLSICRAIVGEFGGALTLASEPGRGTEVTVTLPAATAEAAA
jgi:two-component system C4-dicarboxylate transport sensor histidine kinase DctB